jgi:hypothetical protein
VPRTNHHTVLPGDPKQSFLGLLLCKLLKILSRIISMPRIMIVEFNITEFALPDLMFIRFRRFTMVHNRIAAVLWFGK